MVLSPFPPGMLRGIYKNEKKYRETYFSKFGNKIYFTSDIAYKDEKGLIRIVGRSDDVIKVAAHRLSTGELENIVEKDKRVSECAVVGIPDKIKGQVIAVFVVTKTKEKIKKEEINEILVKGIGKIAKPKFVFFVSELPKTRSGKIMRRILRNLLTKQPLGDISTLQNPRCVEEIKKVIS